MRTFDRNEFSSPVVTWRFVAGGLWIRLAFAGAAIGGLGVVMLVSGDGTVLASLGAIAAGIALAVVGYRQANAALESPVGEATAAAESVPIRSPQTRLDLGFHPKA